MRRKTLAGRQRGGQPPENRSAMRATLDDAAALLKVIDSERREKARGSRRRKDMIGPRAIVADGLGRVPTQENRASMPNRRQQ